jgi:flagellar hook protein FlgE
MGISSSLNASVMGLNVNAQRLAGISDNIANSETYGYKRAETDFSSLVNQGNSSSFYNAGGVRATTVRQVGLQGSLTATGNSTDLSINGRGLIPVTTTSERDEPATSRPMMLTTTGSFSRDDEGYLRTAGGLQLLGWRTDETGDPGAVSRESGANLEPVKLSGFDFAPNPTTRAEMAVNLPSASPAGENFSMTLEYFDAIGNSNAIDIQFESVDPALNSWSMTMTDSSTGSVVGDLALTFEANGTNPGGLANVTASTGTYDAATGVVTVTGAAGPIEIGIGAPGTSGNLTQYASSFAPVSITKNGSSLGFLERVEMTEGGVLEGVYDTGYRRALFQIPVADVSNPEGLTPQDDQAYQISNNSGPFYFWDSGSGPTGTLTGYTLEESTTDITEELTQLIETQRAYSSNAKVVQTVDEMLQETTNLKR